MSTCGVHLLHKVGHKKICAPVGHKVGHKSEAHGSKWGIFTIKVGHRTQKRAQRRAHLLNIWKREGAHLLYKSGSHGI